MEANFDELASDWIAYAVMEPNEAPEEVFVRAWALYDLVEDRPPAAWKTMKIVVGRFADETLYTDKETEAQRVVGNMAAGPLEDLLSKHGADFIDLVEIEARRDRRMRWALGCVWKNSMSDDIWERVQKAAGNVSR